MYTLFIPQCGETVIICAYKEGGSKFLLVEQILVMKKSLYK